MKNIFKFIIGIFIIAAFIVWMAAGCYGLFNPESKVGLLFWVPILIPLAYKIGDFVLTNRPHRRD